MFFFGWLKIYGPLAQFHMHELTHCVQCQHVFSWLLCQWTYCKQSNFIVTWCTWLRFENQQCCCGRSYNAWFSSKKGWWVVVIHLKNKPVLENCGSKASKPHPCFCKFLMCTFSYVGFMNNNCFSHRSFSKFRSKNLSKSPSSKPQLHTYIPNIGENPPQTFEVGLNPITSIWKIEPWGMRQG